MTYSSLHTEEEINKFFTAFDRSLHQPLTVGVIGGFAVMQYGVKRMTKDVDLCFFQGFDIQRARGFIDKYVQEHSLIVDYGFPQRFVSYILNEDLFRDPRDIESMRRSFLATHRFRQLQVKVPPPKYLILVKLEAATSRSRHLDDAVRIAEYSNVSKEELLQAYEEYRPELELVPRFKTELQIFIRDVYNDPKFKLK